MSELLALGISHKTAGIELRERVALGEQAAGELLQELLGADAIREGVAISTCNRTEIYLVCTDPVEAESALLARLARHAGIRPTELVDAMYSLRNCDAARHLFRVTAGLESMIVGESEVQGQVRRAYEAALASGTTGPLTNRLFRAALATGKRVRSETAVSEGRASVASVAVELARELLGDLRDRQVVVLGTGETGERCAEALATDGAQLLFIANRRHERAAELAQRFGGSVAGFDAFPQALEEADIVLTATSSPHSIVEAEELGVVMRARAGRPLLFVDIAVPRDVEGACAELPGVTLHDIDDLQAVVARTQRVRATEAVRASELIEEEIQRFAQWLGTLEVLPTIQALREHASRIVERVLAENAGRWQSMSAEDHERVALVARAVASRLLHEPTLRLKQGEGSHAQLQVVRELFALEDAAPVEGEAGTADVRTLVTRDRRGGA